MQFEPKKYINFTPNSYDSPKIDYFIPEFPGFTILKMKNIQKQREHSEESNHAQIQLRNKENKELEIEKKKNCEKKLKVIRNYTESHLGRGLNGNYDDSTFTLSILGNGEMKDYSTSDSPWYFDGIRKEIKNLTIGKGIKKIGTYSFYYFIGLTSVSIQFNSDLTIINDFAFRWCTSLTSILIPSSVTSLGTKAFGDCTSLTSIIIPSRVTTIGNFAFEYCSKLASVKILNNISKIGPYAFGDCPLLKSVMYCGIKNPIYDDYGHVFYNSPILEQSQLYPIQVHNNYSETSFCGILNIKKSLGILDCPMNPDPELPKISLNFHLKNLHLKKNFFNFGKCYIMEMLLHGIFLFGF